MKKSTSENLSERLVKYGTVSAAMLGMANAQGQINYTDIADITVDATNPRVAIDIDGDGTNDYLFGTRTTAPGFAFIFPSPSSAASSYNSNGIVGLSALGSYGTYFYPSNMTSGAPINATNNVFFSGRGDFNFNSCFYSGSQFCDGMDGFVGLHFKIGANTHYGWARIQVASDATSITIKDYAYNTVAEESINIGQTTLGIENSSLQDIRIVTLNKSISLFNLPEGTTYNLFSISGQLVLNGSTKNDTYVIEADALASGIYVLELNNITNNSVVKKKVIL